MFLLIQTLVVHGTETFWSEKKFLGGVVTKSVPQLSINNSLKSPDMKIRGIFLVNLWLPGVESVVNIITSPCFCSELNKNVLHLPLKGLFKHKSLKFVDLFSVYWTFTLGWFWSLWDSYTTIKWQHKILRETHRGTCPWSAYDLVGPAFKRDFIRISWSKNNYISWLCYGWSIFFFRFWNIYIPQYSPVCFFVSWSLFLGSLSVISLAAKQHFFQASMMFPVS